MKVPFYKMHGCGNDFMVIDATTHAIHLTPATIKKWADRRRGVGFDQLLLLEPPPSSEYDFFYRIYNADGSEAEQCGNGARCVARFIKERHLSERHPLRLITKGGPITLWVSENGLVKVDMGKPKLLSYPKTTLTIGRDEVQFTAVDMGNPHAVILVDNIDTADVARLGQKVSTHAQFSAGINVGFMQVMDSGCIRLRVYERGVGETQACGSGACAAVVAGIRLGLLAHQVRVVQPGGEMVIAWEGEGTSVIMQGPAEFAYHGEWL